jgi:hypothetical protein
MTWRFDDWRLFREASHDDRALMRFAGVTENPTSDNSLANDQNRYLYVGSDLRSFRAIVVSRMVLWLCIGAFVLTSAVILSNFPRSRSPLMAVVMAVLFAGLLAIAPDAAVLAGQLGIIAMVLVIVMSAIRSLLSTTTSDRVFSPSSRGPRPGPPSTRRVKKPIVPESAGQPSTQTMPASPSEASP